MEAKRFEPTPQLLTIYVVRRRWADATNLVLLSIDDDASAASTPYSFIRLRLRPGAHRLTATWGEGATKLDVSGTAGEVQFVEIVGAAWAWGSDYRLEPGDPIESRQRISRARLVADLSIDSS